MQNEWDTKDPDERDRFGIDWRTRLNGRTIVASSWTLVVAAGLIIDAESFDDNFAYVTLDGGTDGAVAVIQNTVTTDSGDELEETRRLPIVSSAGFTASGYTVPTAAAFVTAFPRFRAADAGAVAMALEEGAGRVDTSWREADYGRAIMLYAAHVLTLDGHGTGTEAQVAAEGLGDFQRIKSGSLDLTRFDRARGSDMSTYDATSYGKRFKELLRLNFAGPRIVRSHAAPPLAGNATDY